MTLAAEPEVVAPIDARGDAAFYGIDKLHWSFIYETLTVAVWFGIVGFSLVFFVNTFGFAAGVPDADLAASYKAAMAVGVSYGALKLLRAGRDWLRSAT